MKKGSSISKVTFWSALIFIYGASIYFGILSKTVEMGLSIIAGALVMAFSNIDKIHKFRGAGFEAEMKKAVEEAYATTDSLKYLGGTLLRAISEILTRESRIGGMDIDQKLELKKQLDIIQKELNLVDYETSGAKQRLNDMIIREHCESIIFAVEKSNIDKRITRRLHNDFLQNYSIERFVPNHFRKILHDYIPQETKVEERIRQYEKCLEYLKASSSSFMKLSL